MASRLLRVVTLVFGIFLLLSAPLGAHSEVFERAPLAGSPIGGTVDQVDISFWTPVLSSNIQITDPSGNAVEVETTAVVSEGRIATTNFPALTEPGRYVVTHGELSVDGDLQESEWFFVFDPSAEAQFVPLVPAAGTNWIIIAAIAGVVLIAAGVLWPKKTVEPVPSDL